MITSAERENGPGDVMMPDYTAAGLPIPSKVRTAKMTAITPLRIELEGNVEISVLAAIQLKVAAHLAWPDRRA